MKHANFCILGRSNVGKSTLFNCFTKQKTVVKNEAEVTRDNNKILIDYSDFCFYLIDTGGLTMISPNSMQKTIYQKILQIFSEVDAFFFLLDGKEGWQFEDMQILRWLRKQQKKFYFIVNKIDDDKHFQRISEFYESGESEIYAISAEHRIGIENLLTNVATDFPNIVSELKTQNRLVVSLLGKTNVGKSSMMNAWLEEEKMIVKDEALTTRNAVFFEIKHNKETITIFDTAGIAKKNQIVTELAKLTLTSSLQAMSEAKIILLVIDITQGISEQDLKIASLVIRKNKSLILVFNKLDLITKKNIQKQITDYIQENYSFLKNYPVCFTSAKKNIGLRQLLDQILNVAKERKKKIATADLNKIIKRLQETYSAPNSKKKKLKIFYCTQIQSNPPVFRLFVNTKTLLTPSYEKFVKNQFRYYFSYTGTPIRFFWNNK